jgi:hypothetical protein
MCACENTSDGRYFPIISFKLTIPRLAILANNRVVKDFCYRANPKGSIFVYGCLVCCKRFAIVINCVPL